MDTAATLARMDNAGGVGQHQRLRKMVALAVPITAVLAVATGIMIALLGDSSASYGWFAYAPLSNEVFSGDGLIYMGPSAKVAITFTVGGLLLLAFWSGYRTALRRGPVSRNDA